MATTSSPDLFRAVIAVSAAITCCALVWCARGAGYPIPVDAVSPEMVDGFPVLAVRSFSTVLLPTLVGAASTFIAIGIPLGLPRWCDDVLMKCLVPVAGLALLFGPVFDVLLWCAMAMGS